MHKLPLPKEEILQHILIEKEAGLNFIENKRDLFRNRLRLYTNISDSDNKIYVRLIRSVIETLMSLYYTDEMSIIFTGRQLGDDELSDNLNNLARFDQEEMNLGKLNYSTQWNRLFYGVGIRVFDYWDKIKNVPVYKSINPLCWVPDPNGYLDDFRFHGFELEITDSELTDDIYMNIDKILSIRDMEKEQTKDVINETRKTQDTSDIDSNPLYNIYNHYTTIKGKKYLFTTANNDTEIIRCQEILPVYEEEKKDARNIQYPVILNYYEPFAGDPFGISVPDIIEDKQKAEQLFLNLNRIKAEYNAWGDMYTVDVNALQNTRELRQKQLGPKFVRIDSRKNPNPVNAIPRPSVGQDAYNMTTIIGNQASNDLGLDERAIGGVGATKITATENQRIQRNQNVKLVLKNTINQWGEKSFWRNWLRAYYEYFDLGSEKNIRLQNSFGNVVLKIKRQDIATSYNIDIKVTNKSDEEALKDKEKAALLVVSELVLQDPSASKISKSFAKRLIAKTQGLDKDKISVLFPPSIEETQAKMDLEILNRGDEEEMKQIVNDMIENIDPNEDHQTYLVIYQKSMDTEAKRRIIEARTQAFLSSGQQQAGEGKGIGGIGKQIVAQSMAMGQEQGASSLDDLKTQ